MGIFGSRKWWQEDGCKGGGEEFSLCEDDWAADVVEMELNWGLKRSSLGSCLGIGGES